MLRLNKCLLLARLIGPIKSVDYFIILDWNQTTTIVLLKLVLIEPFNILTCLLAVKETFTEFSIFDGFCVILLH